MAELYGPERKTVSALTTFVSENVTAIKNFAEYVAPGEVSSVDEIKPGQGAIVRDGLKKVAAYRDEQGRLHPARQPALISDAICTGIPLNGAGIVRVTARSSPSTERCSTHRQFIPLKRYLLLRKDAPVARGLTASPPLGAWGARPPLHVAGPMRHQARGSPSPVRSTVRSCRCSSRKRLRRGGTTALEAFRGEMVPAQRCGPLPEQ